MVGWSGVWCLLGPCGHGGPFAGARGMGKKNGGMG